MNLFVAGLSYKTAPVEMREQLAVRPSLLPCYGCRLKLNAGLDEVVLLSTCNRVEIYGTSASWVQGKVDRLFRQLCQTDVDLTPCVYVKEGGAAVEHLFSLASGLDSMVIGETEITGQVKNAYQVAQQAGLTGRVLNRLFQTALQIGKEIRTHTAIGRGAIVSIHNFAHWKDRLNILVGGRIPAASPYLASWDTPGLVRRCSIKDFEDLCAARNLAIKQCIVLGENGHPLNPRLPPNLFGRQAVFVLEHK